MSQTAGQIVKIGWTDSGIEDLMPTGDLWPVYARQEIVSSSQAYLISTYQQMSKVNPKPAGEEPEPRVPTDLRQVLAADPVAKGKWSELTQIARRDFVTWIDSAKQSETRKHRIERACSMLAAGKRRPCCYSIVSLDLHLALKATPMAKAQWSELTPVERRDFIGWMDSVKEPETHRRRIQKACSLLAAGKRRP